MSDTLSVKWTILPQEPPRPLLHCRRCGGPRPYRSSRKIRVNANGKRVDAWPIYRCTSCDGTWNRPVLEREPVRSIDPPLLASLLANDPQLADRLAFDAEGLRCWAPRLEEATQAVLTRRCFPGSTARPRELQVLCIVPHPLNLRLDRLLAMSCGYPEAASAGSRLLERCDFPGWAGRCSHERYVTEQNTDQAPLPDADGWWTRVKRCRTGGPGGVSVCDPAPRTVGIPAGAQVVARPPGPRAAWVGPAARRAVVSLVERGLRRVRPSVVAPRRPDCGPHAQGAAPPWVPRSRRGMMTRWRRPFKPRGNVAPFPSHPRPDRGAHVQGASPRWVPRSRRG